MAYYVIVVMRFSLHWILRLMLGVDRTEQTEQDKLKDVGAKCKTSDKHDDVCMICADGGSLLCCDIYSSTYRQNCMDMDVRRLISLGMLSREKLNQLMSTVYKKLEKMVGVRKELDEGFSQTLL
ncbi:hypothetical protein HYC85_016540 [Camellia sinensis]|uniref:Uncharacterized protein n=1 Tax=Camellia sinensis TaxID=4442 RepID=A0A7J7GZX2_CAMSI|nr:hypothetical protein HYC85_016540 [Camellia sinensis]